MKLYRVFLIVLMTSAFAVVGCGDSNQSASEVCARCTVDAQRAQCERLYNACIQDDLGTQKDCAAGAIVDCAL